jgi:hypothetical protein
LRGLCGLACCKQAPYAIRRSKMINFVSFPIRGSKEQNIED